MSEFIVCYDIGDPTRLRRLHRFLKRHAVPLQYSVFLFTGDDRQLERLLALAEGYIDAKVDDLRAYPLPARGLKAYIGKPTLPAGIQFGRLPVAW